MAKSTTFSAVAYAALVVVATTARASRLSLIVALVVAATTAGSVACLDRVFATVPAMGRGERAKRARGKGFPLLPVVFLKLP